MAVAADIKIRIYDITDIKSPNESENHFSQEGITGKN
jgi:hypothetical protein